MNANANANAGTIRKMCTIAKLNLDTNLQNASSHNKMEQNLESKKESAETEA